MSEDIDRLRRAYAERKRQSPEDRRYSVFNQVHQFVTQQRQKDFLHLLNQVKIGSLAGQHILDVGCGYGGILLEYLDWGAGISLLHGADLLTERIAAAHQRLPFLAFAQADAQHLPYPDQSFDLVLQYTVFSSILDDRIKQNIANEMRRVLRPQGIIVWYDFWLNPLNPQTQGIKPNEIRQLFPNSQIKLKKITLAPPITRRLVKVSWFAAYLLEKIKLFNTHYLGVIRPQK